MSSNMDFEKSFGVIDMIFIGDLSKSYLFIFFCDGYGKRQIRAG